MVRQTNDLACELHEACAAGKRRLSNA